MLAALIAVFFTRDWELGKAFERPAPPKWAARQPDRRKR
jgi:hypothetical protein